jgi:hypothetical protein
MVLGIASRKRASGPVSFWMGKSRQKKLRMWDDDASDERGRKEMGCAPSLLS